MARTTVLKTIQAILPGIADDVRIDAALDED
jgi:hypothetical protein